MKRLAQTVAQFLALHTDPVEIVSAQVSGK
jgi:hypothetical protein